jgi:uncharacterized membrane protein
MTILVLELKVPVLEGSEQLANLGPALFALWPKFLAFIISFVVIATYWNSHQIQSTKVKESDIPHIWMNIFFLLFICLVPFSAALIGEYPYNQTAQFFYGTNLIICGLSLFTIWNYAITDSRLIEEGSVSRELRFNAKNKVLLPPTFYLLGIIISFFNTHWTLVCFALGPIIYFIPATSRTWKILTDPFNKHRRNFQ